MEEFIVGEENIHAGGAVLSSIILKNNDKINMKKIQLKARGIFKTFNYLMCAEPKSKHALIQKHSEIK